MRPASSVGSGPGLKGVLVVDEVVVVEVEVSVVESSATAKVQQNAMMGAMTETFMTWNFTIGMKLKMQESLGEQATMRGDRVFIQLFRNKQNDRITTIYLPYNQDAEEKRCQAHRTIFSLLFLFPG